VLSGLIVMATVHLDDQLGLKAAEVGGVGTNRDFAAELERSEAAIAE